jgi:hypothetical protein
MHVRDTLRELINIRTGCFKRELTVSLKTNDQREGARRDMQEAVRVNRLFDLAERLVSSGQPALGTEAIADVDLNELEASVYAELLANDEAERQDGDFRRQLQEPEARTEFPLLVPVRPSGQFGMEDDHFEAQGPILEELEADYRKALAKRSMAVSFCADSDEAQTAKGRSPERPLCFSFASLGLECSRHFCGKSLC